MNIKNQFLQKTTVFGKKMKAEKVDLQPWLNLLKCKTMMDDPVFCVWEDLYKMSPNAKVILTVREFESWYTIKKKKKQ